MESSKIARALGASRVEQLPDRPAQGPLGLLQLRAEIATRLQSSGGRPSDPSWTVRRVVPFTLHSWNELEDLSERLSSAGRTVSPAQLAAMFIERGLSDLEGREPNEADPLSPLRPRSKKQAS